MPYLSPTLSALPITADHDDLLYPVGVRPNSYGADNARSRISRSVSRATSLLVAFHGNQDRFRLLSVSNGRPMLGGYGADACSLAPATVPSLTSWCAPPVGALHPLEHKGALSSSLDGCDLRHMP